MSTSTEPYTNPVRTACIEWILPVPVTLAAVSFIGGLLTVSGADSDGVMLVLGLAGAALSTPAALLATVVLARTRSRRSAYFAYAAGVILLQAILGAWALYVINVHGTAEAQDQIWALVATALAVFAAIVPMVGALVRGVALKHARTVTRQDAGHPGFHPTRTCSSCGHPLLSDAARCSECGTLDEPSR